MVDGDTLEELVINGLRHACHGRERTPGLWVFDCGFHLLLRDIAIDPALDIITRAHDERHGRLKRDERDFLLLMRGVPDGPCEARLEPCAWTPTGRYEGGVWWW